MKITITFEDKIDGGVEVKSDPTFASLMTYMNNASPTPAMDYALAALNKVRDMSKEAGKKLKPKLEVAKKTEVGDSCHGENKHGHSDECI